MRLIGLMVALLLLAVPALPQSVTSGAGAVTALFVTGASVSSGADTSEDTLQTYVLPANTLVNVGDRLRIFAGGNAIGSTDNKNARLRVGAGAGNILGAANPATASGTRWTMFAEFVKTGPSTQTGNAIGAVYNASTGTGTGVVNTTITDTAPITITVTGQNATAATAGSITCGYFSVELIRAPSS